MSGTAAGAHLPPGTFGKTGTAEFGNDNPPKTHAWFVGYRGHVAFAVLVEGGGVGGEGGGADSSDVPPPAGLSQVRRAAAACGACDDAGASLWERDALAATSRQPPR